MSDSILDPAELEAIQAAMREASPHVRQGAAESEATRLALITSDRDAEAARPVMLDLLNRWSRRLERALRAYVPGEWRLDVASAEIIEGRAVADELRSGWIGALRGAADGAVALAIRGRVVDSAAARRCGDEAVAEDVGRPTTPLAIRLFQPAGRAAIESLIATWKELAGTAPTAHDTSATVEQLGDAGPVVRAAISLSGDTTGQVIVYAAPAALLPPLRPLAAVAADRDAIGAALADVPVEVSVELGKIQIPLSRFRTLKLGDTWTLSTFVDSAVPVRAGSIVKAYGKPIVTRGVLAIEVQVVVGARSGGKR